MKELGVRMHVWAVSSVGQSACLTSVVTASFLSIGYVQFFALSTTWGTCSPLTGNPNPFNKQGF